MDWATQPWTHLLARCKQVATAIDSTHHVATQRIVDLLGLPYTFTFGKVNVDPALETLSQLLIALSISFTLAQPSDTKKPVQLPTELHIITLRELFTNNP